MCPGFGACYKLQLLPLLALRSLMPDDLSLLGSIFDDGDDLGGHKSKSRKEKKRIRAEELLLSVIRREKHPEIRRAEKLIKERRKSLWSRWKRK